MAYFDIGSKGQVDFSEAVLDPGQKLVEQLQVVLPVLVEQLVQTWRGGENIVNKAPAPGLAM